MAQRLSQPLTSAEQIYAEQEAVQEMVSRTEFRQHFQASGGEIGEQPRDREELLGWVNQPLLLYNSSFYRYLLVLLPIVTVAAVTTSFFIEQAKVIAVLLVLSQWIILGVQMGKVSVFHEQISRKKNILEKFAKLLHYLSKEQFGSAVLKKLGTDSRDAETKVNSLASLVSYLNARLNLLTNIVINNLLLYDLQCVYRLEKWETLQWRSI